MWEGAREMVTIHIGQGGVQLGSAFWELICAEHAILANGMKSSQFIEGERSSTFFNESSSGYYTPRVLFIDLDPSVIDEIRSGVFRNLFHPDSLVNGLDDAANNFARGYYTTGMKLVPKYKNRVRKLMEECDNCHGLIIVHASGGGTGSGVTGKLLEHLSIDYGKLCKIEIPIYPSPQLSNSCVEPYNAVFSAHFTMEHMDLSLPMDNEAMYAICGNYCNIPQPTYSNINRLMAILISCLSCSIRFEGVLTGDLTQLQTNIVPFPRIHYPICTYAPMLSNERHVHDALSTLQLTREVFKPNRHFVKVSYETGQLMSCALMYRGLITPKEVNDSLRVIKSDSLRFVDWCPTGFKISINQQPPTMLPNSQIACANRFVCMIANSTAISSVFNRMAHKCSLLYQKRSFVHWYVGEGLEEAEFTESQENIKALAIDYKDCASDVMSDEVSRVESSQPEPPKPKPVKKSPPKPPAPLPAPPRQSSSSDQQKQSPEDDD